MAKCVRRSGQHKQRRRSGEKRAFYTPIQNGGGKDWRQQQKSRAMSSSTDPAEAGGKKRRSNMHAQIVDVTQHQQQNVAEFCPVSTGGSVHQQQQQSDPRVIMNQIIDTTQQQQQNVAQFRPASTTSVHHQQPDPRAIPNQGHVVVGEFAMAGDHSAQQQQQQPNLPAPRISISYTKPFEQLQQPMMTQQQDQRQAIMERIRRRQLSELSLMEQAKPLPEDIEHCAEYNAHGLTDVGWLLLGWREQMLISRLTGVVVQSCVMGGPNAKFRGRKLVLQFDRDGSQLLSIKEWERNDGRPSELARAQPGDRVLLQRLNVTQNKGAAVTSHDNTFLFSCSFGQFSVLQILAHSGNEWTPTNARVLGGRVLAITAAQQEGTQRQQKQHIFGAMPAQQQQQMDEGGNAEWGEYDEDLQEIPAPGQEQQMNMCRRHLRDQAIFFSQSLTGRTRVVCSRDTTQTRADRSHASKTVRPLA
ncbi:hypothetical protein niasHS_004334 [Heterodera schachtii]|uniref:Uncharacterized protein n=1 Tax=Heterodera schachtii TaxID=97005 RepID=A0ABD2JVE9_HETSC